MLLRGRLIGDNGYGYIVVTELKTEFHMKTQIEKLDRLIREIEMDEYLNEETLPKIREAKGLLHTLHEQCNIANVVGQSEQLLVFAKWIQENGNYMTPDKQVKYFLDDNK